MEIRDIGPGLGDHVVVGKVIKAHGIKGEVKVFPYSGRPEDFALYKEVVLRPASSAGYGGQEEEASGKVYAVDRGRSQEKVVILQLGGVTNRSDAEALRDMEVLIRKDMLPPLDPDHYYWHDLKGLTVKTDDGRELGHLTALLNTAAHDILVVTDRGREYLIPAKKEFVGSVDQDAGVMSITPPPGLLEMND